MYKIYLIEFAVALFIAIIWARGIHNMNEEHKDYDGKDFLDF